MTQSAGINPMETPSYSQAATCRATSTSHVVPGDQLLVADHLAGYVRAAGADPQMPRGLRRPRGRSLTARALARCVCRASAARRPTPIREARVAPPPDAACVTPEGASA